jgi:D-sedoheptulose 7-phosphate isomerase
MPHTITPVTAQLTSEAFARRSAPANALADDAEAIAKACRAMAERFARGGRLLVFGAEADAAHVVVEFVHPVIVGKRALPALALPGPDPATQLALVAEPADIALGIATGPDQAVRRTLAVAGERGLLTVALLGAEGADLPAEHRLVVRSPDPLVVRELQVSTYHVLWELAHVFLENS